MKLNRRALRMYMAQAEIYNTAELARATGLHRNQIASLLGGRAQPSVETLGIFCELLNCTPNDILSVVAAERELA